ncbi:MAG: tRNA epoxyqueuosine(34) reductase QueG [Candidatus Didemnitutus sp.]|nr:tRNA epoxyqueuosine(34) reductase QueG [Candidatus Didemnitutus sp.]
MSVSAPATLDREQRELLRARLRAIGFDEVHFAQAAPAGGAALRQWLDAHHHADMAWIERSAEKRGDVERVLAEARSVIVLGVNYWSGAAVDSRRRKGGAPAWARYAVHEDYHDTMKPGLIAAGKAVEEIAGLTGADYRCYTDTGPVLERGWAARAGLGFRGKNGMLISKIHGNWLFLATLVTRAVIEPDDPLRKHLHTGADEPAGLLCGKCTRCIDACPTSAILEPGKVDARRCISYQTIENKGVIPRKLRAGIGDRVYGCDICLEVCPWNRFAQEGRKLLLVARHDLAGVSLRDLLELTTEGYVTLFRRTAVKRLKLTGLLRNACVVAGNSGDRSLVPSLVRLVAHASPLVRAHAVWAVQRLAGAEAVDLLATTRAGETNEQVLTEYAEAEPRG